MQITLNIDNVDACKETIEALDKAIDGKPLSAYDHVLLTDAKSIFAGIAHAASYQKYRGYKRYQR